jgi:hypothetical protein
MVMNSMLSNESRLLETEEWPHTRVPFSVLRLVGAVDYKARRQPTVLA